jgi:hypothetical protein
MRGWTARMRFKRQTMALVRRIFSTYGSDATGRFLEMTFGHKFGRMLSRQAASQMEPEEAACVIAIMTIGTALQDLTDDHKQLALFALQNDNRGENISNHLRIVISAVHEITSSQAYRDGVLYQILGALQGLSGEDLENYRGEHQVANVVRSIAEGSDSPHDIFASR